MATEPETFVSPQLTAKYTEVCNGSLNKHNFATKDRGSSNGKYKYTALGHVAEIVKIQ